nr:hypothetical protein GCM10020092_052740 [Actinoplanes digitatis]
MLCAMFATEHYIPSNRGEVYERCAVMVFDRWDRMRGISRTLGFDGRVRGAVQELAWVLFTEYSPPEQPRSRILRILERYLTTKGFDDDEAAAVAAEFLDYCAGRAWILAEVGSTATESIFGFAHRTFLEFFAAEYLVRMARTPEQVWNVLSTPVRENRWEVVAQLALQRIDRNVDDGGDTVLHLALEEMAEATSDEQAALAQFCSRSLGDVCVSPVLVARLVDMALERACRFGEEDRFLVAPLSEDFGELVAADGPLYDLMYRALPGNLPFVLRCLTDALSKSIEAGNAIALLLATNLSRAVVTEDESWRAVWANLAAELEERHKEAVERWRRAWPWARIRDDAVADEVMNRHGVLPFYVSDLALSGAGYPWVVQLLVQDVLEPADEPSSLPDVAHDVRELLVRRPTPWLPPLRAQSPTLPVGLPTFPVHRLQNDPMPETAGVTTSPRGWSSSCPTWSTGLLPAGTRPFATCSTTSADGISRFRSSRSCCVPEGAGSRAPVRPSMGPTGC